MQSPDSVMVEVIDKALNALPEKARFIAQLQKQGLTLQEIPKNPAQPSRGFKEHLWGSSFFC